MLQVIQFVDTKSERASQKISEAYHVFENPVSSRIGLARSLKMLSSSTTLFRPTRSDNAGFSRLFRMSVQHPGLNDLGWHSIRERRITHGSSRISDNSTEDKTQIRPRLKI